MVGARFRVLWTTMAAVCALTVPSSSSPATDNVVYPGQGLFAPQNGELAQACTAAFIVERNDTHARGVLTAGHCLMMGALNVMAKGPATQLGDGDNFLGLSVSQDSATKDEWERDGAMVALPSEASYSARVGGMWEVGDTITERELLANPMMRVCKLGAVTGLTCGEIVKVTDEFVTVANMRADEDNRISYRGDSGAPMFVFDGDTVRPVAVVSHGLNRGGSLDPRFVTGQLIDPLLREWGLSLVPR